MRWFGSFELATLRALNSARFLRVGLVAAGVVAAGLALSALLAATNSSPAQPGATPVKLGPSGLPIPRFVSLKADRVNVRRGPGKTHAIAWVFARQGLPVEIIAEFENWRQVRDSDGAEGWVFHGLRSGRRTAVVAPWSKEDTLPMRAAAGSSAQVVARVEPGVLGRIASCDGTWCQMQISEFSGWIPQESLWGAYVGEIIK